MDEKTERQMFGMTSKEIQTIIDEQFFGNAQMAAMSILSDAQTVLEVQDGPESREKARQFMNVAKWIIMENMPRPAR